MQDTDDTTSSRITDVPGVERAGCPCPACGRPVDGEYWDADARCEDCAAIKLTLDLDELADGTQTSSPGNDLWPLRNQLMLTPQGEITWRSDVPGGGFAATDAIMLGWLPCNLTGKSLIRIAEWLRDDLELELLRLLAGPQVPAGPEGRAEALERVTQRVTDALDFGGLAEYRVQPDGWFAGERIPASDFLEHPSPAAWVEYQRASADVEVDGLAGWLDREIRARLDEVTYNQALIAAGIEPEEDADTPEEIAALREWAARS